MPGFPITLRLEGRHALVAGGGNAALRATAALLGAGALVRVVAPEIDARFDQFGEACERMQRAFADGDVAGAALVIAATDDGDADARVCATARARAILCASMAEPSLGDFTLPATLRLDGVTIAADAGGAPRAFAKRIVADLQRGLDPNYGRAAATLRAMREYAHGTLSGDERDAVLREASALPAAHLAQLNPSDAQHEIDAIVERARGAAPAHATNTLVCASRASKLALAQARTVAAALAQAGLATSITTITTLGDRVQDRSLAAIGAESLFVKELELALRDGRADYAVHSCKDLPSTLPGDMELVAVSRREDPRDAFCSERYESFAALPAGARVGTSSMRRRAQLCALRPDLEYADIRGNVDTRLRKLRDGDYDAIVLAMAGLARLGIRATHTVAFEPEELLPATGQGALAIEMRAGGEAHRATIRAAVNDPEVETAVTAERAALAALRGGCQAPIGIHARTVRGKLQLSGIVCSADGAQVVRAQLHETASTPAEAAALGERLAAQLTASGADRILDKAAPAASGEPTPA